jgi:hypothetical protein
LGVGPNGEVTTGENGGTYVPACKLNWVTKGSFSGVIHPGNGRKFEQGYDRPLCWLPMTIDNSGGGQVWVDNNEWGPFDGELLHLSYGRSAVYKVMRQEVNGTMQGGVVKLPIKLSSSAMRGRFNPVDKQLYISGFRGWQTNAATASAIQRIRLSAKTVNSPTELRATTKGIYLTFTNELDKFYDMHGAHQTEDCHVMMFDNGNMRAETTDEVWSRGVEYELDFETMTVSNVFEFRTQYSAAKGSFSKLDNGLYLVTCPKCTEIYEGDLYEGYVYEVNTDGEILSEFRRLADMDDSLYRAHEIKSLPTL